MLAGHHGVRRQRVHDGLDGRVRAPDGQHVLESIGLHQPERDPRGVQHHDVDDLLTGREVLHLGHGPGGLDRRPRVGPAGGRPGGWRGGASRPSAAPGRPRSTGQPGDQDGTR